MIFIRPYLIAKRQNNKFRACQGQDVSTIVDQSVYHSGNEVCLVDFKSNFAKYDFEPLAYSSISLIFTDRTFTLRRESGSIKMIVAGVHPNPSSQKIDQTKPVSRSTQDVASCFYRGNDLVFLKCLIH